MRPAIKSMTGPALWAPLFILTAVAPVIGRGGEPGRFGRLFRFGQSSNSPAESRTGPTEPPVRVVEPMPPTAPVSGSAESQPRILPQPRVTRGATDADPVVTRISLGRTDDGTQFGMFLQVYADGTVIDSEGVHSAGRQAVQGVLKALEAGELYRLKGHCGGPPTDFVEQVQMVVYERSIRGLRANAFSFSGNTQGCDHAVQHLQKALDTLQTRISRPATAGRSHTTSPLTAGPDPIPNGPPILLNAEPGGGH